MKCTITPRGGHSIEITWTTIRTHYSKLSKLVRVQDGDEVIYRGPHLSTNPNVMVAAMFGAIRLHLDGKSTPQKDGTFILETKSPHRQ